MKYIDPQLSVKSKFSNRFRLMLKETGLSKRQIYAKTGISEKTLTRYEKNLQIPTYHNLRRLALGLELSATWLLCLDDEL